MGEGCRGSGKHEDVRGKVGCLKGVVSNMNDGKRGFFPYLAKQLAEMDCSQFIDVCERLV
jgi:hypothetical protein